jgi:uncharacterized phage-like protein YoqJ
MTFDVMFTGHRPPKICGCYDEDHPKAAAVRDWLRKKVAQVALEGAWAFVSGGALGTDQWGAEAVLDRGLQLTMAIPCDDYCSSWPQASQDRFRAMLSRAASVEIVCPGPYASYKNLVRDQWMVDRSKQVIAVFDGTEKGGTWHTIKAAQKAKLPIMILNPTDMSERMELPS